MEHICIYLRKSRADEELEKTVGQGETLTKHKKALLKFAKEKNLNIVNIKEEIVSGESLLFRPQMLQLLQEVEEKKYTGVLVMDMQRLGRGDMQDQGIILKTFKNSRTKIITPQKTYDLNNDFDEEYSEFEAFMSRKELKMINRRMQGGRTRSVEDGNYISTNPPLGYDIQYINKSRTLAINEDEAKIVNLIFEKYVDGIGASNIAAYLNTLGVKTKLGNNFSSSSVLFILKNLVYIGKITWKKKDIRKSLDPNKVKDTVTRDKSDWIIAEGKHQPIIDEGLFYKAKDILENRYHVPYQLHNKPINGFAGVLLCRVCGKTITTRILKGSKRVMCIYKCGNISTLYSEVEETVNNAIQSYIDSYKLNHNIADANTSSTLKEYEYEIELLSNELKSLKVQKNKLFDLLERGIYDENLFLSRSENIATRISTIELELSNLEFKIEENKTVNNEQNIEVFEKLFTAYKLSNDIDKKNSLLKQLVTRIEYLKENKNQPITITLYPKLIK